MRTWLRIASLGGGAAVWLRGREVGELGDLDEGFLQALLASDFAGPLAAAVDLCGYWLFISWLTRRRLNQTGWRATRIIWPTTLTALGLLTMLAFAEAPEDAPASLTVPAIALNLPLFPLACLVRRLFALGLPWWILVPVGTAAAWFCWWAIIVFFERRARDTGPVTLKI